MPFLFANTSCTSSIYTAVPARMDTSVFRFHRCSSAVAATAMASGSPWLPDRMSTLRRLYTTSNPIMAGGSSLPRSSTTLGSFFPSENSKNGVHRVICVARATISTMTSECTVSKRIASSFPAAARPWSAPWRG